MKKILDKFFDGAKWWEVVIGEILMVTPFLMILWKM